MKGRRWVGPGLLGVAALALIALALHRHRPATVEPLRIWGGSEATSRALFAEALATSTGGSVDDSVSALHALAEVNEGRLDAALVPGALPFSSKTHLRQVAVLQLEPLHLLVRAELATAPGGGLDCLRGRRIDFGPPGRTELRLARAVLAFAGIPPQSEAVPDGYLASELNPADLVGRLDRGEPLPDAVFLLETMPSEIARRLVIERGFRLLALPFAEAFALRALPDELEARVHGDVDEPHAALHRGFVYDAVIPPYTYSVDPPVPAEPLHTLATRLLLVAHERVAPASVERLLDIAYSATFGGVMHPPLDPRLLVLPPELPLHPGTVAYLRRNDPAITQETLGATANLLSVGGAVLGSGLFVWQFWRQRLRVRREETFEAYILKVASIERRAGELELAAELELEPLIHLQRDVTRLKSEALARFSAGELEGRELMSGFLTHANDVRDYLARLILHVRQLLEQQADAEGRSVRTVWKEEAGNAATIPPATGPADAEPGAA